MPTLPPNLDTIKYPSAHEPKLILSVSDDAFAPRSGAGAPLDLYVEKLELGNNLLATNSDEEDPARSARLGLFVGELVIPASSPPAVKIGVCGADGRNESDSGGRCGGTLDIYLDDQEKVDIGKLQFECTDLTFNTAPSVCTNKYSTCM